MLNRKKIAICLFTFANASFGGRDDFNPDIAHSNNIEALDSMLKSDKFLVCPIVCGEKLCKFEEFQTFCKKECEIGDDKIKEKRERCMGQKSIAIPPLSLVTGMIKGTEVGSNYGGLLTGGAVSAGTSLVMDEEASGELSKLGSLPGAAVGAVPGAIGGLIAGGGYAVLETALISFCLGFCTKKMCSKSSIKSICKTACSKGREPYIKHCLEATATPSKPR